MVRYFKKDKYNLFRIYLNKMENLPAYFFAPKNGYINSRALAAVATAE